MQMIYLAVLIYPCPGLNAILANLFHEKGYMWLWLIDLA